MEKYSNTKRTNLEMGEEDDEQQEDNNELIKPQERARGQKIFFVMGNHFLIYYILNASLINP